MVADTPVLTTVMDTRGAYGHGQPLTCPAKGRVLVEHWKIIELHVKFQPPLGSIWTQGFAINTQG